MEDEEEQMVEESYQIYLLKKAEKEKEKRKKFDTSPEERSCNMVEIIESVLKNEYPDIHVEHLRDCGTRIFYFECPISSKMVSLIQIPVRYKHYTDEPGGPLKLTIYFDTVIFNVTNQKFTLDEFYKMLHDNPDVLTDYIAKCRKDNLSSVIFPQVDPFSMNDTIKKLSDEMIDEMDKETLAKMVKQLKKENYDIK
jgi:hypothetical protein